MKSAQEKINQISEISNSNLSETLKLDLVRDVLNKTSETSLETSKPSETIKTRKTVQTVKRDGRPLMKYITRELLSSCAGATEKEIVDTLSNLYPEKEVGTIEKTTKRRLKGEDLNLTEDEEIVKEDELYFLRQKEEKPSSIILT